MSSRSDGGRIGSTVPRASTALGTLPCENDRAKPDRISRLARSTNCQRSLRVLRLSGTLGIEARTRVRIVLELDAQRRLSPLALRTPAFWREPSNAIKIPGPGQGKIRPEPLWITRSHGAKIKERPAKNTRATRARGSCTPGSCNGLFSVGFPTGVQGHLPHLTQRTSFPLPSDGAGTRPPGGSTAHPQLVKSSTATPGMQAARKPQKSKRLRPESEYAPPPRLANPPACGKAGLPVGNTRPSGPQP